MPNLIAAAAVVFALANLMEAPAGFSWTMNGIFAVIIGAVIYEVVTCRRKKSKIYQ